MGPAGLFWSEFAVVVTVSFRGCCGSFFNFLPRERAHSLKRNDIGAEGARAVAEALKSNATLTALKCVSFPSFFSSSLAVRGA